MQEMGLCLYHRRNPKEERLMNEPNLMGERTRVAILIIVSASRLNTQCCTTSSGPNT